MELQKFLKWALIESTDQVSSNYSRGNKFDATQGVTSFTWDYIGKTLEISCM